MNRWAIGIIALTLILAGAIYGVYEMNDYDYDDSVKSYKVINKWELPSELEEISGIYWMGDEKIACVQDEEGIIFIYDLSKSEITHRYKFGAAGDYESLTSLNGELWVCESNGKLFNIKSLEGEELNAEVIELEFEYRNNIEGLTATENGDLWLSVKERNLDNSEGYRGIYSFDPKTKKLNKEPVLKIMFDDPKFEVLKTRNPRKLIRPSELAFSPDGDLYVLDAEFQKVINVAMDGKIKKLHLLDPEEFAQPEGICFSPSGRMFISSEARLSPANITEIQLLNQ